LVNGTIAIESKPRSGTMIAVRVPLESARDSHGTTQLAGYSAEQSLSKLLR